METSRAEGNGGSGVSQQSLTSGSGVSQQFLTSEAAADIEQGCQDNQELSIPVPSIT